MKRMCLFTSATLLLTGTAFAGHLSGGVNIESGLGTVLRSFGWAKYEIHPPAHDNSTNQITGKHMISYDGIGPGGLIAYQYISETRDYEQYIEGNGEPGACYRARVTANMSTGSNAWGSHQACVDPPPPPTGGHGSPEGGPGTVQPWCETPLVVDLDGDGLTLSGNEDPVLFDLTGDGEPELITWTAAGANDGFLAIDLNGNGRIDGGRELFGSQMLLPSSGAAGGSHGFRPLADYDAKGFGGNENFTVESDDAIFAHLRIWVDRDHDGRSAPDELVTLAAAGIHSIDYGYGLKDTRDAHGNVLWLEGRAWSDRGDIDIVDVIFLYATPRIDPAPGRREPIEPVAP